MTDNEIDCLIERLNNVRLKREAAVRVIGQSDRQEAAIVRKIQNIRADRTRPNLRHWVVDADGNHIKNNLREGQIVRITNYLRDEHSIVGKDVDSTGRIVDIRN